MSQIITNAFASYLQASLANQTPVVLDEFVLANIPGLDPNQPISPDLGLPPAGQIVHRRAVDQRGRINNDAVAYTIVMDTTVGDFSFNALYLINKASGMVGMIVHKGLETKLKTNEASGQTGNSLVKSMLMEYDRASEATATHVDASTWQIDYAARLRGMDDDLRLQALQFFGPATFYGDGFKLVNEAGVYKVQPGVAYVGGLRAQLDEVRKITPGAKPVGLWLDIYRAGSLLNAWVNHFTLTLSVPALADYVDGNGNQHHVTKVAIINSDGSVTDLRRKRTIELSGDVTGKGILEDAQGVNIAVEVKDNSHGHQMENVAGLTQALASKLDVSGYKARRDMLNNNGATFGYTANKDLDSCLAGDFGLYEKKTCPNSPPTANPYFYCETKRIYAYQALLQVAWPYDGGGVLAMRNYSINSSSWSPWREIFDTGHQPTIQEVEGLLQALNGLSPTSHSHPGSWLNPINLGTEDLDTLKEPKVYAQHANANTSAARHYPENSAGALIVSAGAGPQQTYLVYNSSRVWRRAQYSTGAWTPWTRDYNTGNKPTLAELGAAAASHSHPWSQLTGIPAYASRWPSWAEVTGKPGTMPPSAHTHTAAQGNADVVAGGVGQIGTYGFFFTKASGAYAPGRTLPGSSLRWSSTDMHESDTGGGSPAGTWKLMGYYANNAWTKSLWIRIA
ncbi:phage tail-collar fiber domain-containing protein [Aeromonas caviae]|uniref:phage tail-collar fiber domain-containing protein n=1 Tax=Aeromonas caviae TaxID=648 RepID=UPI0029DA76D3|nr:phage tail protein [Aeromonas caviae]MDX7786703.1 phage tail protein [Aeromonas caviae]